MNILKVWKQLWDFVDGKTSYIDIGFATPPEDLKAIKKDYMKLADEHKRVLGEWYKDCEELHKKIVDLSNINRELEQDLLKAKEVLQHIEEQSRKNTMVVVGSPLREAVCNCLDSICQKVDLSKD